MKSSLLISSNTQRGLSLVELMVAMAIGLVVILATMATYLGSSNTSRLAEAQGRMNEDANAALSILSQHLRMAGSNPKQANRTSACPRNPVYAARVVNLANADTCAVAGTATYILRGCDGRFSNITSAANLAALTCTTDASKPDSIAVSYEADAYNTEATGTGVPTDCLGQSIPMSTANVTQVAGAATSTVSVSYYVADNRFYVGTSTLIVSPSLYCKGNGNATPQPLIENIEDLQLSYGTGLGASLGTNTLTVSGYLNADEVLSADDLAALPDDPTRWGRVQTVRLCVVARSESPVLDNLASARYIKCDGTLETNPPDLRMRRAYSTTVVLRNRVN